MVVKLKMASVHGDQVLIGTAVIVENIVEENVKIEHEIDQQQAVGAETPESTQVENDSEHHGDPQESQDSALVEKISTCDDETTEAWSSAESCTDVDKILDIAFKIDEKQELHDAVTLMESMELTIKEVCVPHINTQMLQATFSGL